ncbi:MAG: toll/interleukin-1 receptor domain-containing protein, partial [Vicinamibacterales bacterium]
MTDSAHVGPPFSNDLFISYSHGGDDGTGQGFLQPWSARFARELDRELRVDPAFRDSLRIFLDSDSRPERGVDPMEPLTQQLRRQIEESAVLVVLMSPDYLKSTWCAVERDWWFAKSAHGLPTDDRVAVVNIMPTEKEGWPAAFVDGQGAQVPGFRFFAERGQGLSRPLGWPDMRGPSGAEFSEALLIVVGRLSLKLTAIRERLAQAAHERAAADRLALSGGQSIYLHGRPEERDEWQRRSDGLTEAGFVVWPTASDPVEQDVEQLQRLRETRVAMLCECDALLLLPSANTGAFDLDLLAVGHKDRQSARARSNHPL